MIERALRKIVLSPNYEISAVESSQGHKTALGDEDIRLFLSYEYGVKSSFFRFELSFI